MQSVVKMEDRGSLGSQACQALQAPRPLHDFKQIMVPIDLNNDCSASIDYAICLAKAFGSTVNLLHLYEEPYALNDSLRSRSCDVFKQQRQKVFMEFYNLLQRTRVQYPESVGFFEYGSPDHDICKIARQLRADLLILCTHNHNWLEHLLGGSHAQRILQNAPCPVLIVRAEESNPSAQNP